MRRYLYFILTLNIFSVAFVSFAQAQEADRLGGYVPPPLFGTSPEPTPEQRTKEPKLPVISKEVKEAPEKIEKSEPLITERVVKEADEEPSAPVADKLSVKKESKLAPKAESALSKKSVVKPAEKPKVPTIIKEKIEKTPVKPGPEPIDLLRKKDVPPPPPFKEEIIVPPKVTSEGIVKGPKIMPSNKKQSVDTMETFKNKGTDPSEMMKRVQEEKTISKPKKIKTDKEIEIIKDKIPLPELNIQKDGSRKISMLYLEEQADIKDAQINILEQVIIPELKQNNEVRLIIQAYASSPDDSLNSDRRLALTRALAVRDYILSQEIASNRMDVRALGSQTNVQPINRVELYLAP